MAGTATQTPLRTIRIGRSPDSDVVLDLPMISWEHARVVVENGTFILEDLNSRNGTSLNRLENRITRAAITPADAVYLGSYKIPAARLLTPGVRMGTAAFDQVSLEQQQGVVMGRDPECGEPLDDPLVSWHHARIERSGARVTIEDLGSRNGTFVDGMRISSRTEARPGQEIGIGSFQFRVMPDGQLERREYHGNVSITAAGVTVEVNGKRLLDPISLTVFPSEMVALMGPAGAGKTTLLKALNGYTRPAAGQVLFNGMDLYQHYDQFRQQMGYVPQDDIVHSQLTVREALYFSTRLRTDLSDREIETRIDKILDELGILDKKDTLIGSPEKKVLSGGQRKRVNIAMELITDTPVLFLDEPTSGLSSYDAEGVIDLLRRLAAEGKTIITTIHQPSVDVYRRFDNLIMISRDRGGCGSLVYYGPAFPDSIEYFHPSAQQQGDRSQLNPEMLLTGLAKAPTAEWAGRFARSRYRKLFVDDRVGKSPGGTAAASTAASRRIGLGQWWTLLRRNVKLRSRDKAQAVITLLQAPLFAVLIALVFGAVKDSPKPTDVLASAPQALAEAMARAQQLFAELSGNLIGIEFLLVVAAIWFGCNNAARDMVGEWSIFQRERMVNLKLPSYVFAKFTVLVGLCAFQTLTLLTVVYFTCGLKGSFWREAAVLLISSLVGAALGLAISARSATTETAIALLPVVLLPVITLGGGIRAVYKMPAPARLISYVVPSRWAFERNLVEEAKGHVCGYLAGPERWDDCPGGGKGVDAATIQVPKKVSESDGMKQPSPLNGGRDLRASFLVTMAALGAMLVVLLGTVLGFLRMRDII